MYTFSLPGKVAGLFLLAPTLALAQNIVTNSGFDDGLGDWTASATAEWSPSFGYEGGSLFLPSSTSTASQCISAGKGDTYIATVRVYSHCVGARFYLFWATAEDCHDTGSFPDAPFAVSTTADEWELLSIVATSPSSSHFASVSLFGGCADGIYFDDVTVKNDFIMISGFE